MGYERTSVGLEVHARSVAAAAIDGVTGEIRQARLTPSHEVASMDVVFDRRPARRGVREVIRPPRDPQREAPEVLCRSHTGCGSRLRVA